MPRTAPDPDQLARRLRAGERAALSQAITLVESQRPRDRSLATRLLGSLPPPTSTFRLGVTGAPGVGKSTFIEAYGAGLLAMGHRLAVLAVDPSSRHTRGSILGDKTRMPRLSADRRAFVRPSPAGDTLGGVAHATRQTIALCEAAGYDRVLVETVGVGQSEHAVAELVDAMALLVLPGAGDDLQGVKRGIVELADLILVHKADGDRDRMARVAAADYRRAVHLQPPRADGWSPRVVTGSSVTDGGLVGFGESLTAYAKQLGREGLQTRRRRQHARWFERSWPTRLAELVEEAPGASATLAHLRAGLAAGTLDVDAATATLLDDLRARLSADPTPP